MNMPNYTNTTAESAFARAPNIPSRSSHMPGAPPKSHDPSECTKRNGPQPEVEDTKDADSKMPEDGENSEAEPGPELPELNFVAEQCLFCNTSSSTFDDNILHMSQKHGLFIPDDERLIVELETLVRYLHLVIFGYVECLSCHTQRQNLHAVQQHMISKGHCKFDIEDEESEFADFYDHPGDDEPASDEDVGEEIDTPTNSTGPKKLPVKIDDNFLRLSSGKVLSHRSAPCPKPHRPLAETHTLARHDADDSLLRSASSSAPGITTSTSEPVSANISTTQALTRAERRGATLTMALSRLSLNDRAALAHLSAAQQRAVVLTQFKQQHRQRAADRKYWSRQNTRNNQNLMKHFVSDVPGPRLG